MPIDHMNQHLKEQSGSTSHSLLARIRLRDDAAWRRFATIYSPLVYGWARRTGLQPSDAADVVQDVFQTVFRKIDDFQKDGQQSRFRGWLWAITRNRVRLFYRQAAGKAAAVGGSDAAEVIGQIPAALESDSDPSDEHDQRALVQRALGLIRGDFTERSWQAFWRVEVEGHAVNEVAADLNLTPQAVRQAKYRVLCRLRDELDGLC